MLGGELVPQHLSAADREPGVLSRRPEALREGQAGEEGKGRVELGVAPGTAIGQIGIGIAVCDLDAIAAVGGRLDAAREALGSEACRLGRPLRAEREQPCVRPRDGRGIRALRFNRQRGRSGRTSGHRSGAGGPEKIAPIHAGSPVQDAVRHGALQSSSIKQDRRRSGKPGGQKVRPLAHSSPNGLDRSARGLAPSLFHLGQNVRQ